MKTLKLTTESAGKRAGDQRLTELFFTNQGVLERRMLSNFSFQHLMENFSQEKLLWAYEEERFGNTT